MIRDTRLAELSQQLCKELLPHATRESLERLSGWESLHGRLEDLLGNVRMYHSLQPVVTPEVAGRVRAAHWNIEKGIRLRGILEAIRTRPELRDADLLLLNEVDLGMARSGNRDVAGELADLLGFHGAWAPMFLELSEGRDDDPLFAGGRANAEALLGVAILSRWPIGITRIVPLPSPERQQFERERMFGRHVGLIAEIQRPDAPFVAVSAHLEVHRSRTHRAVQMEALLQALWDEPRPVLLAGDFNTHTFDRGSALDPLRAAMALAFANEEALARRLRAPEVGEGREPLFSVLRAAGFEWEPFVDREPTLQLRFSRIPEAAAISRLRSSRVRRWLDRVEQRSRLRLDWFAGRGWRSGTGVTLTGLDGPGAPSDHAPIAAVFLDSPAGSAGSPGTKPA